MCHCFPRNPFWCSQRLRLAFSRMLQTTTLGLMKVWDRRPEIASLPTWSSLRCHKLIDPVQVTRSLLKLTRATASYSSSSFWMPHILTSPDGLWYKSILPQVVLLESSSIRILNWYFRGYAMEIKMCMITGMYITSCIMTSKRFVFIKY